MIPGHTRKSGPAVSIFDGTWARSFSSMFARRTTGSKRRTRAPMAPSADRARSSHRAEIIRMIQRRTVGVGLLLIFSAASVFAATRSEIADAAMRGDKPAIRGLLARKVD